MVRRRPQLSKVLVASGALLIALAIVAFAVRDRDGRADGAGDLAWAKAPRVFTPERLPRDRVLTGRLRNDSLREVRLSARDLRLEDGSGRQVEGTAVFLDSFMHGLYPPTRQPAEISDDELRRTGRLAVIPPGESVPLTVAWRRGGEAGAPVRLRYGAGYLPVPQG
jgi:hypothetical protein